MNDLKDTIDIINTIPEETKKEIYKDGLKKTVIETGETLSLIPRVIKNALAPIEMWCINTEFRVMEFKQQLQKKLENKNTENIVNADPSIFIPSVQAVSYNWEKETIKDIYLNLITSDMDKTQKDSVHPSFVEIIKQMDEIDVKVFTMIYTRPIMPFCVLKQKYNNGTIIVLEYLLPDYFYNDMPKDKIIKSLNNLERLKLIKIIDDEYYVEENIYDTLKNGIFIQKYKETYKEQLLIEKGMIIKTQYGKDFYKVCCE